MNDETEYTGLWDAEPAPVERRGFAREQMVACEACLRTNAPTRLNCLYCGAALPATEASAHLRRPTLRPLEEWEQGFDVVLLPQATGRVTEEALAETAEWLKLEVAALRELSGASDALPLVRAASSEEAELITRRLAALGFAVETFTESDWPSAAPPRRVRALELTDDALLGRTGADREAARVGWSEVALLVLGRLYTKRIEVEERTGRLRREEVVEARELMEDEAVLDIYAGAGTIGWRIAAESFDYSCLGAAKGLLARDNFLTLTRLLRERAGGARFDDDYRRVRHLLAHAWPLAERRESQGLRRERPGKFNTEAVTTVSNEMQFTRYARLRWACELRRRTRDA